MDREIPVSVKRKRIRKHLLLSAIAVASVMIVSVAVSRFMNDSLSLSAIHVAEVDRGSIEISIAASGKWSPLTEEIVVSPIHSRILEVYKTPGDTVYEGEPLLKLDLASVETEYRQKLDERQIMQSKLVQLQVKLDNTLSELIMQKQIKEMQLQQLDNDLESENYLDSIGAGTTDRKRRAQLAYNEARLELQQLDQKIGNEQRSSEAELNIQKLELSIFDKTLAANARLLKDARILSPRKATLTFINNQIGAPITQGSEVAIVADLTRFKVDAEVADGHRAKLSVGSKALIETGDEQLSGTIHHIKPSIQNGIVQFTVIPDDTRQHPDLRSGLTADVHVSYGRKQDVLRIPFERQFVRYGKGVYTIWVLNGNRAEKRQVSLGESSYDYIEVVSGLSRGEKIILSGMDTYKNRETIQVKQ